ncbi:MAG: penicillin acylase family protein [Proteobacteria bacterium]|nr:penicillin acylase family protein [Pseudomonadota bacterium]
MAGRARRWALGGLAALLALLVLGAAGGYGWLRLSLPVASGRIALAGPSAPIELVRDADGLLYVFAGSEADAYFGLGFAHAQDRMFQMDFLRRLAAGRLAEVLGARALPLDRFMRTLGLDRLATQNSDRLSPETRGALESYAAGVNAYLATHRGPPAPEFALLAYRPARWRPADSLLWGRLMAMQLGNNWRDELLRARLASRLSEERLRELWPGNGDEAPLGVGAPIDRAAIERIFAAIPDPLVATSASNMWALDGRHTVSGKPLLANDPHLAFGFPVLWYLARVETPTLTLAGATVPGVPFHVLGHNGRLAWAFTTTHSDTQDLFVERQAEGDPGRYLAPGGPTPFATRDETIAVRFAGPETLRVRATRHGPVISDLVGGAGPGQALALAATALEPDDRTADALYRLNRARDWRGVLAALESFHAPQQNVFVADTAGEIGFLAPGRVPIRRAGDGFAPVPGWSGEYDWTGFAPFGLVPRALNPPSGRLVNANNRIVPDDYPLFLAREWRGGFRARRIGERLDALKGAAGAEDMAAIQMDVRSLAAAELLPLMTRIAPGDEPSRAALALLSAWDGGMAADRPEPLIFADWLRRFTRAAVADELGGAADDYADAPRPVFVARVLAGARHWCDDQGTAEVETCEALLARTLAETVATLGKNYGPDMGGWRWGAAHRAEFAHPVFRWIPGLRALTSLTVETGGGDDTVSRGTSRLDDPREPFLHIHGAGYRAVYDLADLDRSRFIIATGQSGNPLSPVSDNLFGRWREGGAVWLGKSRAGLAAAKADILILAPR